VLVLAQPVDAAFAVAELSHSSQIIIGDDEILLILVFTLVKFGASVQWSLFGAWLCRAVSHQRTEGPDSRKCNDQTLEPEVLGFQSDSIRSCLLAHLRGCVKIIVVDILSYGRFCCK